jgi:hypothetical protein
VVACSCCAAGPATCFRPGRPAGGHADSPHSFLLHPAGEINHSSTLGSLPSEKKDYEKERTKAAALFWCGHRLNMELDLQSLFGLLCTVVLIGEATSPRIWAYI